jgi:hypothetical protein
MKRIFLVLAVAALMAVMLVVMVAPAFAAQPTGRISCQQNGEEVTALDLGGPKAFREFGNVPKTERALGLDCERTVTPQPGPPS